MISKSKATALVVVMFVIFGIYAIVLPQNISQTELEKSYDVLDLIRGWGIYSLTIGLMLMFRGDIPKILAGCLIASIGWHAQIIQKNNWTEHHKHSIAFNSLALLLVAC